MEIVKVAEGGLTGGQQILVRTTLRLGGVLMHATETCYGFTCDFSNPDALQRLYDVKRIPATKPVSIMARDLDEAQKYGVFSSVAAGLAREFWPGPLTIILSRTKALPDFVNPGEETVGIRCPDFPLAQELIELNGRPLLTTSANIGGEPESYRTEDYLGQVESLKGRGIRVAMPDLILDSDEIPQNPPSTIVRMVNDDPVFLRDGALREKIESFLASFSDQ